MVFRKGIEKYCAYCAMAVSIDNGEMYCRRRGVVSVLHRCPKFKYDPVKREPPPLPDPIPAVEPEKMKL